MTDTESAGQSRARAKYCVENALREVNSLRAKNAQIPEDGLTEIAGAGGLLDSLGFVNLAVALDLDLAREFGPEVSVMAELLAAADPSEFATIDKLVDFVSSRIERSVR